jgi:hypothetical protein
MEFFIKKKTGRPRAQRPVTGKQDHWETGGWSTLI